MIRQISCASVAAFLISCGGGNDGPSKQTPGDVVGQNYYGDSDPGGDSTPQGVEINGGWLGGACDGSSGCDNPDMLHNPECLTAGFPNGFCTQDCAVSPASGNWACDDTDYSGMNTTSRCIDANGSPQCVSECDFTLSPQTGCRPGYTCVSRDRYDTPTNPCTPSPASPCGFSVCLPADIGRWPGEDPPDFDIGDACVDNGDCEHNACLKLGQDGYCSKDCAVTGCPGGSTCFTLGAAPNQFNACLRDCGADSECRQDDNYECDSDNTCWPEPPPSWNSSVGSADCLAAWGNLHACDTSPDDYVVINKAARNVALCTTDGAHVQSFHGALGFSPLGDKIQNGDGRTPEGVFYIPRVLNPSEYYKAFLLSYPDKDDAARGVSNSLVTGAVATTIDNAQDNCLEPPQDTALGGFIELHGTSQTGAPDWTWGCVAVENAAIDDYLWDALGVGDTIVVLP